MFKIGSKRSFKGLRLLFGGTKNKKGDDKHQHNIRELFIGHRTLYSLLGATVGGILVGRSLWELSVNALGIGWTICIGAVVFIFSGYILHSFREDGISS